MKSRDIKLTQAQREELDALAALPDEQIDTSDAPEVSEGSNSVRGLFHKSASERSKAMDELRSRRSAVTDTSERGLEDRICEVLAGGADKSSAGDVGERPAVYGVGWRYGDREDYDREYCVDLAQLSAFLVATQPKVAEALSLGSDNPTRRRFLTRLKGEVGKRGIVDVLRNGVKHGPHDVALFYGAPSPGNRRAVKLYEQNRFSVTRQLSYSNANKRLTLDLGLFINGLPVATFELKNSLTKQTVADAVEQYKRDRDPREDLFRIGRCLAHFAVDEHEVMFCTHLRGKSSWFLPFNKGLDDGAGNPVNPNGLKTDYLWQEVLTRQSLTDIIENYALLVESVDTKTGRRTQSQIWPRYHQLDVVRKLLADAAEKGAGQRYLIQHSAGSGKSNSIAWLAHRLIGLEKDGETVFDSIIVVTDRIILDRQINDTIRQFAQVSATVGHAEKSGDLRRFIGAEKKIIISTVQKFPFILDEIGTEHRGNRFAIIIDEAHSSQGGRTSSAMAQALGDHEDGDDDDTFEDKINRIIEQKRLLTNASYFAFTATPKNKTLELFGTPSSQSDGTTKHLPFHSYAMKQAIEEGFILDVLGNYTPVTSYYHLAKTVADDPEFDTIKAKKKLVQYVETHSHAIRLKAEIMVDHFHEQVLAPRKIGGQARAMVVTGGIQMAITYYHAIRDYLKERNSPHKAIVAFSGEVDYGGDRVSEASLNGFPSSQIANKIQEDPYRFLVCADKFQTGYDEPLLHVMYVDKVLSGIKAVQTLSRLNRAHPEKRDTFVLDFYNDADGIRDAFADYYRTTILADETDPNKLHDLKAELDGRQVYSDEQVHELVASYLKGDDRGAFDPTLDECVAVYRSELDEDGQVEFKGNAKAFVRAYNFLSQVLPYENVGWEKLSIFLNFLVPKLPTPITEDLSLGIEGAIDMDSYRAEKQATMQIMLSDEDAEIEPVPTGGGGFKPEPEMDRLSNILRAFNDLFGDIPWTNEDRIRKMITEDVPRMVDEDSAYRNAREHSDEQNTRIEHDKALEKAIMTLLSDDTELYKQYSQNEAFKRWLENSVFELTNR